MSHPTLHALVPGSLIDGDWYAAPLPGNIIVGDGCFIDSAFCFKHYFSSAGIGLRVGNNVTFWRTSIAVDKTGYIEVGNDCYIANASLVSSVRISIGSRVMIAGGVTVVDSDFHPLGPAERIADSIALSPIGNREKRPAVVSREVTIGDDVWVGYNATVLKGVSIGAGAVVEPGSVVIRDVPPGVTVAGNPAHIVAGLEG